jgi:hypothetical protein
VIIKKSSVENIHSGPSALTPTRTAENKSISLPLDNILRTVVTVVRHFMTEFNGAVLEESKLVAITKIVLNLMEQIGQ